MNEINPDCAAQFAELAKNQKVNMPPQGATQMSFAAILAWAKGLSLFAKVTGGLGTVAGLGFLGPFGTVFGFLSKAIKTLISWVWEALELTLTHPVILTLLLASFWGGAHVRGQWDKHTVAAAKQQAATLVAEVKGAANVEKQKAAAAIAARDAAKALSLFEPQVTINADHPLKASVPAVALNTAKPGGVRKPADPVRSRPKCDAVFCF